MLYCLCLEFEKMAANELKGERHISPGEAQFLWQLIQDYGNNYKVSMPSFLNFINQFYHHHHHHHHHFIS